MGFIVIRSHTSRMVLYGSTTFCADCPGLAFVNRPLDASLILCTPYRTLPGFLLKFGPTECN